ncbi:MAG: hypothetical protein ACR2L2_14835 [Acidobacteriota bacterium]
MNIRKIDLCVAIVLVAGLLILHFAGWFERPKIITPTSSPALPSSLFNQSQQQSVIPKLTPERIVKRAEAAVGLHDPTLFTLNERKAELVTVPLDAPEYRRARALLVRIDSKRKVAEDQERKLEIVRLRETLRQEYEAVVARANPHMNFIKVKVAKSGKGYALWAVHSYFTSRSFALGDDAKVIWSWIAENRAALDRAGFLKVGLMGEDYGSCWYDLK